MRKFMCLSAFAAGLSTLTPAFAQQEASGTPVPIRVGFLWHMHQPIYVPYLDPFGADPFFSFSVPDVHNGRLGPYTTWPRDAIVAGSSQPFLGAQVSFSGSLMENLDALESAGVNGGIWNNWESAARNEQSNLTALGNRRLEMIGFGYHHPLMPLIGAREIRMQLRLHRIVSQQRWQNTGSRGLFPPETGFSTRMIPALVAEGIEWVLVDNIHFDRATLGYPHTNASNLFPPNKADQINPNPEDSGGRWVQLNNLWAPSRVSVPFGYQPHHAQHVDPDTGEITRIVAVPAARYEGNEDGRGGYGAFLYDQVMDAYLPDNTDPDHPMFVVLHHDGDNFGGGSEAYYHSNFSNMVAWDNADPDYETSTINDYLDRFPVDAGDVIHIEDGSWAGADNGDPEFKKWLGGDVSAGAVSPDINSWAALVAARNFVATLEQLDPVDIDSPVEMNHILHDTGDPIHRAWRWLLVSQASDYWYWDGTEVWDSNVTRGSNEATSIVSGALSGLAFTDQTPPTVFVPQREPYNPGGLEWNQTPEPSDFEVWTLIADYSGVASATLNWRTDADGLNPLSSIQNETYAGGPEVSAWNSVPMTSAAVPTPAGVLQATHKATRFGASITGQTDVLIDYYVEATDAQGNVQRSDIMHVWVGASEVGPGDDAVTLDPETPVAGQSVTITYDPAGGPLSGAGQVYLHYGFDEWSTVIAPDPAMTVQGELWTISVPVPASATQLDIVFNDGAGVWDNNAGQDWHFDVDGGNPGDGFEIDGALDPGVSLVASNGALPLYAALDGSTLYLATTPAGGGLDRFLVVAEDPGAMVPAMWGKSGQVAQWDAFVGAEGDNMFVGWFDQDAPAQVATGSVLEATIDLAGEFGALPDQVHVAVLSYQSPDGGALVPSAQVPASLDGDTNAQAGEFLQIALCDLDPAGCCPADLAPPEGVLDFSDVVAFLSAFGAMQPVADMAPPLGVFDFSDVVAFLGAFGAGCP